MAQGTAFLGSHLGCLRIFADDQVRLGFVAADEGRKVENTGLRTQKVVADVIDVVQFRERLSGLVRNTGEEEDEEEVDANAEGEDDPHFVAKDLAAAEGHHQKVHGEPVTL